MFEKGLKKKLNTVLFFRIDGVYLRERLLIANTTITRFQNYISQNEYSLTLLTFK